MLRLRPALRAWIIALCLFSPAAQAGQYWFEFGGGLSQMEKPQPFFGSSSPSSLGMGSAFQFGLGARITRGKVPIHFMLQERLVFAGSGSKSYGLRAEYPGLRLDFYRVYVGLGFTTLIWQRTGSGLGIDGYYRPGGARAGLAEIGVQMPITPEVSFNLGIAAQFVQTSAGSGPSPTLEGIASFRFFYGSDRNKRATASRDFRGWRYPFGVELN